MKLSLERALEYIDVDEFVEATPKNLRLRKKVLDENAAQTFREIPRDKIRAGIIQPCGQDFFCDGLPANSMPTRQTSSSNSWSMEKARMVSSSSSNNCPAGLFDEVLHVHHQPLLRIQFLVRALDFVKAVGEQHHEIAGREHGFRGFVRRFFKQSERGLAVAAGVGERLDAIFRAAQQSTASDGRRWRNA